jgi:hypothetical protein
MQAFSLSETVSVSRCAAGVALVVNTIVSVMPVAGLIIKPGCSAGQSISFRQGKMSKCFYDELAKHFTNQY